MEEIPSKPYLIRALHEWCTDNGYTPHIVVDVRAETRVPKAHVHNGQITLNISTMATQHLVLNNEHITFQARFGGVTEHVFVPTSAVVAIYARETGAGMGFEVVQTAEQPEVDPAAAPHRPTPPDEPMPPGPPRRPKLTLVK